MKFLEILEKIKNNDPSLISLNLSAKDLDLAEIQELALAMEGNTTLTSLALRSNQIGPIKTQKIAIALLVNKSLISISLGSNELGAIGAEKIAVVLQVNNTLTAIDLSMNKIDAVGVKEIAAALKVNITLTSVNLSGNDIESEGLEALEKALKYNYTLCKCILPRKFPSKIIDDILSRNNQLTDCLKLLDGYNKEGDIYSIFAALEHLDNLIGSLYPEKKTGQEQRYAAFNNHPVIGEIYNTLTSFAVDEEMFNRLKEITAHPVLLEAIQKRLANTLYMTLNFSAVNAQEQKEARDTCQQILSLLINYVDETTQGHWSTVAISVMHYLIRGTHQVPGEEKNYKILYPLQMKQLIHASIMELECMNELVAKEQQPAMDDTELNKQKKLLQNKATSLNTLYKIPVFKALVGKKYPGIVMFWAAKEVCNDVDKQPNSTINISFNQCGLFSTNKDKVAAVHVEESSIISFRGG